MRILTSRFDGLCRDDYIKETVEVIPPALGGLASLEVGVAAEALTASLKEIFLPNKFVVEFIKEMVGRSALYCSDVYKSEAAYLGGVYSPRDTEVFPICLTGLAGVGKSQLIAALRKVLPGPVELETDHFSGKLQAVSHWYASGRGKAGGRQLLLDFLGEEFKTSVPKLNSAKLLRESRRRSWQEAVALAILDETQHINTGSGAARFVEIILTLSGIGPSVLFVSNYSLLHKLLARNSEDKQRLLSEPKIMVPDVPGSQDWYDYLHECVSVGGENFSVTADEIVDEVFKSTHGIKRLVVQLFKAAYVEARRSGRGSITFADIVNGYRSVEYASNRLDVEELQSISVQGKSSRRRLDLVCPFELPSEYSANVASYIRRERDIAANRIAVMSALTPAERSAVEGMAPDPVKPKTKRRPAPKKATNEQLVEAFYKFGQAWSSSARKA
ncbi:TPA: AAA family ATPase [Pseudomonas aeruginosa]